MRQSLAKVRRRDREAYPQELKSLISTTNALERFAKEVQRRSKVIEPFSQPEAEEKGAPHGYGADERKPQEEDSA